MSARSGLRQMFGTLPLLSLLVPLYAVAQAPADRGLMTRSQFDALFVLALPTAFAPARLVRTCRGSDRQ